MRIRLARSRSYSARRVGVAHDLPGPVDRDHPVLGLLAARQVRMPLLGEATIGGLDHLGVGFGVDLKGLVGVECGIVGRRHRRGVGSAYRDGSVLAARRFERGKTAGSIVRQTTRRGRPPLRTAPALATRVAREEAARDLLHRDVAAAWEAGLVGSGAAGEHERGGDAAAAHLLRRAGTPRGPGGARAHRRRPGRAGARARCPGRDRSGGPDRLSARRPVRRLAVEPDPGQPRDGRRLPGGGRGRGGGGHRDRGGGRHRGHARGAGDRAHAHQGPGQGDGRHPATCARPAAGVAAGLGRTGGGTFELWMRLRLGGESGVGRPEEVVAALGERLGRTLVTRQLTRERIVLSDDPEV